MLKIKPLINQLLPEHCIFCEESIASISSKQAIAVCEPCLNGLPWRAKTCCPQCALGISNIVCGNCLKTEPYYDATHAVCDYDYPIDAVLQAFKYQHALHLCDALASLLAQKVKGEAVDLILAMPMHPTRLKERGFNQSLEIAKVVSKQLNIPFDTYACKRVINTPPQAGLALKERAKNIKGAFECTGDVHNLRIAVIDDVMTSGASLNELAKILKKAGASSISNWVIARTL